MGDAIARERAIRERVWAAYCQPREAFGTLEEWNNYLEEREDVAFSLVEGVDVARAEARLRAYTAENADSIAKHQAQRAEEEAGDEARRMSYRMASQGGRPAGLFLKFCEVSFQLSLSAKFPILLSGACLSQCGCACHWQRSRRCLVFYAFVFVASMFFSA